MLEGVGGDFVEVLQDQFAQVAVQQRLGGQEALAAAFVDAVGDGQEDLGFGNAAGHGMGEEHVAAVGYHAFQLGHRLGDAVLEAPHADLAALFDVLPVQLVVLPAFQGQRGQQFGRRRRAVLVEAGHQRHIDNAAAEVGLGRGQFFFVQRAQLVVFVAAAHGHADDVHAGLARFVDQAVGVAAAEQFAEQDEDVAGAEQIALRKLSQGACLSHIFQSFSMRAGAARAGGAGRLDILE